MRSQIKKKINFLLIAVFFLGFAGYVYAQTKDLTEGPQIFVSEPENGSLVTQNSIMIEGEAQNISWLSLNGKNAYTNEEGNFSKQHILLPGLNLITIEAGDRYGKTESKEIWIYHKADINNS